MAPVEIRWEGIDEFQAVLDRAVRESPRLTQAVVKNHTEEMSHYAHSIAPEDTGYLKSQIQTQYDDNAGSVISGAGYSGFLEWGTRNMGAQPYMGPALNRQVPFFKDDVYNVIRGVFK